MRLEAYLSAEGLTLATFGEQIGRSAATISRLVRGLNKPGPDTVEAIYRATGGKVTANDLHGHEIPAPPEAA